MNNRSIPEATLGELLRWLLRRRRRLHVVGESMLPTLAPGDTVLLDPRAYRTRAPSGDDVVAALHPREKDLQIVKRVAFVADAGDCYLFSDNPSVGSDSRTFGTVPLESILGRVTSRIVA